MSAEGLYHSPFGLHPFQAEGVARMYLSDKGRLAVWSTGLGKTHLAMGSAALLFEDGKIDRVLVACETGKLADWVSEFERFTDLTVGLYHGSQSKRSKMRDALHQDAQPQVLVSTYETVKADAVEWQRTKSGKKNRRAKPLPGPLAKTLEGQRVLVVYDEATKLKNRSSDNYRSHDRLIEHLRDSGLCMVLALTATPVERGPEDIFNIVRLIDRDTVGKVADFERDYVLMRDLYGRATYKNLSESGRMDAGVVSLDERIAPLLLVKRKTDPDVVQMFPEPIEEFDRFALEGDHAEFYTAVMDTFFDGTGDAQLFGALRQACAYPAALLGSEGQIAKRIVDLFGPEALRSIGSTKTRRLLEYLSRVVAGQGEQALVFTFFGPSVIPLIKADLESAGYRVGTYFGTMSNADREEAKARFKSGEFEVLLSSDSGARGLNLPEATYIVQYDLPFTYATYLQRMSRNSRISQGGEFTVNLSYVVEQTVEEGIMQLVWERNRMSDEVLGDEDAEGAVTADMRRRLMEFGRSA